MGDEAGEACWEQSMEKLGCQALEESMQSMGNGELSGGEQYDSTGAVLAVNLGTGAMEQGNLLGGLLPQFV